MPSVPALSSLAGMGAIGENHPICLEEKKKKAKSDIANVTWQQRKGTQRPLPTLTSSSTRSEYFHLTLLDSLKPQRSVIQGSSLENANAFVQVRVTLTLCLPLTLTSSSNCSPHQVPEGEPKIEKMLDYRRALSKSRAG